MFLGQSCFNTASTVNDMTEGQCNIFSGTDI